MAGVVGLDNVLMTNSQVLNLLILLMNSRQYTVRNIPEPVDAYLRKKARLSGKSVFR
jgi:hypothetical protein